MKSKARNVDEYLAALSDEQRATLQKLRKTIHSAAPRAEEVISYGIPCFKYHGPLVFFAAFPKHCSLFAVGKSIVKQFAPELKPFKTATTTIHFSPQNPLPAALVRKIVKARMKENKSRAFPRKKK